MRILVVEDEADLRRQLADALTHAGYAVDLAADGEDGHFLGDTEPYDAVILDLGLPKMDGVTILERWREDGKTFPVMILTARDRWSEKVAGFDAGADDYVTKPFYTEEVLARLRALLRRASGHAVAAIEAGALRLDTRAARATVGNCASKRAPNSPRTSKNAPPVFLMALATPRATTSRGSVLMTYDAAIASCSCAKLPTKRRISFSIRCRWKVF